MCHKCGKYGHEQKQKKKQIKMTTKRKFLMGYVTIVEEKDVGLEIAKIKRTALK